MAVVADQTCLWNSGLCEEFVKYRRDIFSSATNGYKQTMKEFQVEIINFILPVLAQGEI